MNLITFHMIVTHMGYSVKKKPGDIMKFLFPPTVMHQQIIKYYLLNIKILGVLSLEV